MNKLRPRHAIHQGRVPVTALLFQSQQRLLQEWKPGSRIFRLSEGWLLLLPEARLLDCARAPGLPLTAQGPLLTSAPLQGDELESLGAQPLSTLLVVGGQAKLEPLGGEIDASAWLDLSRFQTPSLKSLGAPLTPRASFTAPPDPNLREALKAGAAPSELDQVMAALRNAARSAQAEPSGFWSWLQKKLLPQPGRTAPAPGPSDGALTRGTPPRPPGPWMRRFQELTASFVMQSQLGPVLGRRQAKYIHQMMDKFRGQDLLDALRHAIPLSSLQSSGNGPPALPMLGLPTARSGIALSTQTGPANTRLLMGSELFAELKILYRRAHERLAQEGKIEEAAFVLLELLQETAEGLDFLEKHERYRLAAEIAEGRKMPPERVLRLWLLAGNLKRALLIARRSGAFADAVLQLERTKPELAQKLRMLWADILAESGDFVGATQAIWPVETARNLAKGWMDMAIEAGGPPGARMLARRLSLEPSAFPRLLDRTHLWIEEAALGLNPELLPALANELTGGTSTPELQTLARAVVRAMVELTPETRDSKSLLERLVQFSGDRTLATDLQKLPAGTQPSEPLRELVIQKNDAGNLPIQDAARLPGGRFLLALGEPGVRLVSAAGKTKAHFNLPAHRLVIADHGSKAITLARRGEAWSLGRIDLTTFKAETWCLAQLDQFATSFDGLLWFIGVEDAIWAVDPLASHFEALWQVREEKAKPLAITRSEKSCACLFQLPSPPQNRLEVWVYDLPSLILRSRKPLPVEPRGAPIGLGSDGKSAAYQTPFKLGSPHFYFAWDGGVKVGSSLHEMGTFAGPPLLNARWAVLPFQKQDQFTAHIVEIASGKSEASLKLQGPATPTCLRLEQDVLTIADARGRLISYHCTEQRILANLRL